MTKTSRQKAEGPHRYVPTNRGANKNETSNKLSFSHCCCVKALFSLEPMCELLFIDLFDETSLNMFQLCNLVSSFSILSSLLTAQPLLPQNPLAFVYSHYFILFMTPKGQ